MITISGNDLSLNDVWSVSRVAGAKVQLSPAANAKLVKSRKFIDEKLTSDQVIYGVNTGFGALSKVKISKKDLEQLQINLIRSHSCGVGDALNENQVRAIMLLRANTLAKGTSGVRPEVVEKVLEFLNKGLYPLVPSQGSVGASGDLAPLAHLALCLIGEGKVFLDGKEIPTNEALKKLSIAPLKLQAKEGLSLINGCQVMTAIGMLGLYEAIQLVKLADVAGAMSLEALRGSRSAFDPEISRHRPHFGEKETAANLLKILQDSEIAKSHIDCDRVQDAYSLRCMPAVHGAAKSALKHSKTVLEIEANASTDNPLVFVDSGKILSCGNFHGQPVSVALDYLAIALTSLASISERRIEKLINPAMSELPAFLTPKGGLNSGFMMAQVTAAALVSESKIYSHPASVDSIPTSADKEDHVSMGTIASRKLIKVIEALRRVLCIEFLAAKQGLYLLKPQQPGPFMQELVARLDKISPCMEEDRVLSNEISNIENVFLDESLLAWVEEKLGGLEC